MFSSAQILPLSLATHRVGRRTVIEVSGEIDMATADALREAMRIAIDDGALELWVDLTGVEFMDSTGLHVLVAARERLAALQRRMTVICPRGCVRRVIDITGLDGVLDVVPSRAAAHHAS